MVETYVKVYRRIVESSVWKTGDSDLRVVWVTLLALKDENGCVFGSLPWLADMAVVPDEACKHAIEVFKSPDPRSRNTAYEGRKIVEIDGGWQVLNHFLYRDGMEDMRAKWRNQKARQRAKRGTPLPGETAYANGVGNGVIDPKTGGPLRTTDSSRGGLGEE